MKSCFLRKNNIATSESDSESDESLLTDSTYEVHVTDCNMIEKSDREVASSSPHNIMKAAVQICFEQKNVMSIDNPLDVRNWEDHPDRSQLSIEDYEVVLHWYERNWESSDRHFEFSRLGHTCRLPARHIRIVTSWTDVLPIDCRHFFGWIHMVSGQGSRQRQQVVHIFTGISEVDKNPPVRRNTPQ